jgi:hypothetical protein
MRRSRKLACMTEFDSNRDEMARDPALLGIVKADLIADEEGRQMSEAVVTREEVRQALLACTWVDGKEQDERPTRPREEMHPDTRALGELYMAMEDNGSERVPRAELAPAVVDALGRWQGLWAQIRARSEQAAADAETAYEREARSVLGGEAGV